MLRNNLKSTIESEALGEMLMALEINPLARGEELSVADWVNLSDRLLTRVGFNPEQPES